MASRSIGGTVLASGIRTREKKERKLYSDDWALGDEEIEGHHTFNLEEKITTPKFNQDFVKDMTNLDFGLSYMQRNGFNWPLVFRDSKNLGIVVPGNEFSINDVRLCVGSKRMLDVMDVNTQKNVEMTMKDWQRYYESEDKDKLLNVISLEFSHTRLESLVEAPLVVRQIDWVERVWPRHLKEAQTESTNVLEDMMYPKVQKYCLMSVSGCYTDFHIDFGGTSVWYHILKGKKIFWLIPASERNLQLYEQWVLSGKQSDIFFGDTVEKCARVELLAGYTFFIPTGWIHAVYTPEDSLVFGGNFLHSFGIEKQLRVAQVEDTTHVPQKFRYPFFTEMLWYVLERYVHVLLGKTHLYLPSEEQKKYERTLVAEANVKKDHTHITQYELHGLKAIVMYLHSLPTSKKFVPELIKEPIELIRDVRTVVEEHRYDKMELAITNVPVLEWWSREPMKFTIKRPNYDLTYAKKRRRSSDEHKPPALKSPPNAAKLRHRRVRCRECDACTRDDCRACSFCKDMVKYGGPGTMKQSCRLKKCIKPSLPAAVFCHICQLDGWNRSLTTGPHKAPTGLATSLMECSVCFQISHTVCMAAKFVGVEGIIREELPNSWECPECISLGFNKEFRHNRVPSSRVSSTGSETNPKSPNVPLVSPYAPLVSPYAPLVSPFAPLSEAEENERKTKVEEAPEGNGEDNGEDNGEAAAAAEKCSMNGVIKSEDSGADPTPFQFPKWEELQARVSYPLVRPSWIIRPAQPLKEAPRESGESMAVAMKKEVMVKVFSHLPRQELLNVMRVCSQWAKWANDPSLWKMISFEHRKLEVAHLHGVARRQPRVLSLNWSAISYEQLSWLLPRLPQLAHLQCEGLNWGVVRALVSPYCPALTKLDLSFCGGLDNETLSLLLKPPHFFRPGHRDSATRLRTVTHLSLSGTQVGDEAMTVIARSLHLLSELNLSHCPRVTEVSLEILASPESPVSQSLTSLDLRDCNRLSPFALPALARIPNLVHLALDPCRLIPLKAQQVWGQSLGFTFDFSNRMSKVPLKENCLPKEMVRDNLREGDGPKESEEENKKESEEESKKESDEENKKESEEENKKENGCQNAEKDDDGKSESGSTAEGIGSDCRRSERSNKGFKYESLVKGKPKSTRGLPPSKLHKKKNVLTRSKRPSRFRISLQKGDEREKKFKSPHHEKRPLKLRLSLSKGAPKKGAAKLRLSIPKGEPKKGAGKLRAKLEDNQSPKISSEEKLKPSPKRQPSIKRKKTSGEGKGSVSSSRSNSPLSSSLPPLSSSASSLLPANTKLKVELESIGKVARRRSDVSCNSGTPVGNRPERHHRSPRRLSMGQ